MKIPFILLVIVIMGVATFFVLSQDTVTSGNTTLNSGSFQPEIKKTGSHQKQATREIVIKKKVIHKQPSHIVADEIEAVSMGEVEDRISNHQLIIKKDILKLDQDLHNQEVRNDLEMQLRESTEYRRNLLIKAKQQMKE